MPSSLLVAARVVEPEETTGPGETRGPEQTTGLEETIDPEGTLLAVVPIPGTDTSLAIVGYTIPTAPPRPTRSTGPTGAAASASIAIAPRRTDGGLVVDHARRCAWLDGKAVGLTYQEFELLAFLSARPDQVVSRADLLAQVWGQLPKSKTRPGMRASTGASTRAPTRTVDVHVSRLRRKLGPVYSLCLTTEHRVGYRFDPTISSAT
jgi:Transcriptional regulatory protein, C terminal